jgi:sugar O-acyltransferase (sialic acid O-acetyltransferase NeuD family)
MIVVVTDGPLVVVGAGGHGREAVAVALAAGVPVVGVLDDGVPDLQALAALGVPHLGGVGWLATADPRPAYVAALGYPGPRREVAARADAAGAVAGRLLHPAASVGPDVELAAGTVLWPQVAVTTAVRIGRHTHLNVGSSVSHDCRLGAFVTVGPGARICGSVVLADDVWIGAGATVIQGVRIGAGTVVGAGAVVLSDVPAGQVVVGVPARALARDNGSVGPDG